MLYLITGKNNLKNCSICDIAHINNPDYSIVCTYVKTHSVFPLIIGGNFYGFS